MGRIVKILLRTVMWVAALLLLTLSLLYVPMIQDAVSDVALQRVSHATGLKIYAEKLRLRFPVDVSVGDVEVLYADGDTMLSVGEGRVNVGLMSLFDLSVGVDGHLQGVRYFIGNADSAMCFRADMKMVEVKNAIYDIANSHLSVAHVMLDGGGVELVMDSSDSSPASADSTQSVAFTINAGVIDMRNVSYRMAMLPSIDSLSAIMSSVVMRDAVVDMSNLGVNVKSLHVDSDEVVYLFPETGQIVDDDLPVDASANHSDEAKSWTVAADSLRLSVRRAVYARRGILPKSGLDVDYVEVSDVKLDVDSFYNRGTDIEVPIKRFVAKERCGLELDCRGVFSMDSNAMSINDFNASTLFSNIYLKGRLGLGNLMKESDLPVDLYADASIGIADVEMLLPTMKPVLSQLPRYNDMKVLIDVNGTIGNLKLKELYASLPGYMYLKADGHVENVMKMGDADGYVNVDGELKNVNFIKPTILEARLLDHVEIPPIAITGNVDMNKGDVDGLIRAVTGSGDVVATAKWNGRMHDYDVDVTLKDMPMQAIFPTMGLGEVSAELSARGHGVDFFDEATRLDADMKIMKVQYIHQNYDNIRAWAHLDSGDVKAAIISLNELFDIDVYLDGKISADRYSFDAGGDVRHLDLNAIGVMAGKNNCRLSFDIHGDVVPATRVYASTVSISDLEWRMSDMTLSTDNIDAIMTANDSVTNMTIHNDDLVANMSAKCSLDTLLGRFSNVSDKLSAMQMARMIDVEDMQRLLPKFTLEVDAGNDNLLASVFGERGVSLKEGELSMANDSLFTMHTILTRLKTQSMTIDTLMFNAFQRNQFLIYRAKMDNRPGSFDAFAHVDASGYVAKDKISMFVNQRNIRDEVGFKLGLNLSLVDSMLSLRMTPQTPIIGYKEWNVNANNAIEFDYRTNHLDANLKMQSGNSHILLYTEHDHDADEREDVVFNVSGIELSDWLSMSPFAPPIKGVVGADMRFSWDAENKSLAGNGEISVADLYNGRNRVGSFDLATDINTTRAGVMQAKASLMVDSVRVITANGVLNDSAMLNPFMLDFSMIKFPLRVVNPFLPKGSATLSGMLNGEMDITGDLSNPIFNGYIDFDSAAVKVGMIGASLSFPDDKIPVDSNIVKFDDYSITAINSNPLYVDGRIDMSNLLSPEIDLSMKANSLQFVNSERARGADVYGKGFLDIDASVNGNLDFLRVNADVGLLAGSNVTYVMTTATSSVSSISQGNNDMVRFVEFNDSSTIERADTIIDTGMSMMVNARLDIESGTTINVDLSTNGKDKVQVQGSGLLTFEMNPFTGMRLTGRYTIDKGFVRYTPPLMSEKLFNFDADSYVAFNGDVMNPILNIHATETLRANVTEEGQNSRLIDFDVKLGVTNTLSNMNVAFDLSTNDDITIQNELQSMTSEQRASQAMNLLLYNVYTGPGTTASGNLSGNPLYSFISSQINSWMANNVKWIDVSFGIDKYDRTYDGATSSTTNYSYRVSKSLFDDRFKIVVGGNYSTDADTDENFSQNLVNDISFEYMLNRSGSMYVRLFRYVGYESILEGEVTQ
ncbi:MAG: translocation/assembly module TamB domain-containing protein, partial [Muribaculaceae bacterium]|nr:translocation/assembly module TamB domain-containing protein [Muribaculaceae bacterium]